MTILFLCHEDHLCREPAGYARALARRGVHLVFVEHGFPPNGDVRRLVERCSESPSLILHPELIPLLPAGLTEVNVPSACLQVDTYTYTHRRIRWSMLFDYALLFHPGFEPRFRRAGHPMPLAVPHAVDAAQFVGGTREPIFDIGWVGAVQGRLYRTRRRVLARLSEQFKMNEWARAHSFQEMVATYTRSRVVINIGRDDYPQDANLRVFEAMAAGALLITKFPSELSLLGFEDGVHFVGYREDGEIVRLVRHYLGSAAAQRRIAEAGRGKVLREHTYDCRVAALLEQLRQDNGRLFAPARGWPAERVHLAYLDYYTASSSLDCAWQELRHTAQQSLSGALVGASLIAGAWTRKSRGRLLNALSGTYGRVSAS